MKEETITTHELYRKLADLLCGKHADAFYDYILHAMDMNSDFLRTKFCYSNHLIRVEDYPYAAPMILITSKMPIDFKAPIDFYEAYDENSRLPKYTKVHMQIFLFDMNDPERRQGEIQWSKSMNYVYYNIVDLKSGKIKKNYGTIWLWIKRKVRNKYDYYRQRK